MAWLVENAKYLLKLSAHVGTWVALGLGLHIEIELKVKKIKRRSRRKKVDNEKHCGVLERTEADKEREGGLIEKERFSFTEFLFYFFYPKGFYGFYFLFL